MFVFGIHQPPYPCSFCCSVHHIGGCSCPIFMHKFEYIYILLTRWSLSKCQLEPFFGQGEQCLTYMKVASCFCYVMNIMLISCQINGHSIEHTHQIPCLLLNVINNFLSLFSLEVSCQVLPLLKDYLLMWVNHNIGQMRQLAPIFINVNVIKTL